MKKKPISKIQHTKPRKFLLFYPGFILKKSEDGIALLMVLFVLVLLMTIALNFYKSNRWNTASTRNLKEETISYYLALSGYHESLNYIMADKDHAVDFVDDDGNFWVDKETKPITGKRITKSGEIEIKIVDEGSKININYAQTEQIKKLLEYSGIPQDSIAEIIDSLIDWKDSGDDDAHHLLGAESDYYEDLEQPYQAKNALIDVPEELTLVKGMAPEYLFGDEEYVSFLPHVTTFGTGVMNINTVSREVMELLGLSPAEIEAIVKQRSEKTGGFRIIPQEFSRYGLRAIVSRTLRIEIVAAPPGSSRATKIEAVVHRSPSTGGYKVQTVYWRESVENTGS